jgi:hypothetical protein
MNSMLAYTVHSSAYSGSGSPPYLVVGSGSNSTYMRPDNPQDDSYWIVIINAKNPREKVKDWIVPGTSNSTVPSGLDTYMSDPDYIYAIATQYLSTLHVPQGAFYDYLVKYGAGRELQRLEQVNAVLSCGTYSRVNYLLTGQCGPRGGNNIPPPSYEMSSFTGTSGLLLLMSLMSGPNGSPPWSICDCNAFMSH